MSKILHPSYPRKNITSTRGLRAKLRAKQTRNIKYRYSGGHKKNSVGYKKEVRKNNKYNSMVHHTRARNGFSSRYGLTPDRKSVYSSSLNKFKI